MFIFSTSDFLQVSQVTLAVSWPTNRKQRPLGTMITVFGEKKSSAKNHLPEVVFRGRFPLLANLDYQRKKIAMDKLNTTQKQAVIITAVAVFRAIAIVAGFITAINSHKLYHTTPQSAIAHQNDLEVGYVDRRDGERFSYDLLYRRNSREFKSALRVEKTTFLALSEWLEKHTILKPSKYVSVRQKLMIFLWICGQNKT